MKKEHLKKIENAAPVRLGKADLHIHSNYSDGRPTIEEILDYVEHKTDLDVIAITDHNTIDGAYFAKQLMEKKRYRFQLVIGEEISTVEGHLLGLFLTKPIPAKTKLDDAIRDIHKQGGIAIVPHMFEDTRMIGDKNITMDGIGMKNLLKEKKNIDGVEIINATPTLSAENIKAALINNSYVLKAETGSSDAHIVEAIGKGYTAFEGKTAQELKNDLKLNQTKAMDKKWTFLALIKYLFFFIPIGLRIFWHTILHGHLEKKR